MARPRKESGERRDEQLKLRLTLAEIERLREQAATSGLTVADYARRRILGLPVSPAPRRADAALLSELNRIGVNINQIARSLNRGQSLALECDDVLAELRRVMAKVAGSHGA